MRIQFGWHLDGARWPETPDGGICGLGDAVVGPQGLLGLLESVMGLGGPDAPQVLRVAQFLARLRAVDDGARFFSASLAADGWSVAALILCWRDALVEAGWTGADPAGGERLSTLAAVERADGPLAPGRADRLRALLDALAGLPPVLPVSELRLATPAGLLPPGWRLLLDWLAAAGVRILPCKEGGKEGDALGAGDLAALGRRLAGDRSAEANGDGSVTVLEADDEWMAAEVVAGWLAARPDLNHQLVIVRGQRTTLLDEACRHLGLPRPGGAGRSPWRGAAQVLPLAFAALWEPLDAHRLMELLTLPQSPIPSGVAEAFADALVEAPGIGGPVWQEAWRIARDRRRARLEARGLSGKELERRLAAEEREWRGWLESARFPETEGVPVPTALALCGRVAAWARGRAAPRPGNQGGERDEMLDAVADQAETMAAVVAACGLPRLSRPQLDRMLDMVVADGVAVPAGGAEAAAWATVDDPGQIWGAAGTVLWWGFVEPAAAHSAIPWSNAERLALAGAGGLPEPAGARLAREAWAWRLPLLNAVDRLILVKPRRIAGEPTADHPLWHEIGPALARCPPLSASAALTADRLTFADRTLVRKELEPGVPPQPRARWRVPIGAVAVPDRLSATSLERLLGCPLAWVLHHVAGIRPGVLRAIPDGVRLLGSLAHAVLAELLTERPDWTPEAAAARAAALFDRLLPALAAPLLRPGLGLEMERARAGVAEAARRLVALIAEAGLRVRGCEVAVEAELDGVTLEGRIDLLLETAAGAPVVLDLKWSGGDKRRRQEIAEGRAVQLAVYGRLVGGEAGPAVPGGYMMLAQQRLLACAPDPFPPHLHVPGSDLPAVWRAAWSGRSAALELLADGDIRAAGLPGDSGPEAEEPAGLTLEPPCNFCGYGRLCGVGSVGA